MRELILAAVKGAGGRIREAELAAQFVRAPRDFDLFYGCVLTLEDEKILVQEGPYVRLKGELEG